MNLENTDMINQRFQWCKSKLRVPIGQVRRIHEVDEHPQTKTLLSFTFIRVEGGCLKSVYMVHAKNAKMKRKERKTLILKYLYFVGFAKSLRFLRGIRLLIQPLWGL